MNETLKAGERMKLDILEMGMRLWSVDPQYVTARRIARELKISHGSISYHFARGERSLRDCIAFHSVKEGNSRVIAQLIAINHSAVAHMQQGERLEHLARASVGVS